MIFCVYKSVYDEEFISHGKTPKSAYQEMTSILYPAPLKEDC
jgi:hypothetical protein